MNLNIFLLNISEQIQRIFLLNLNTFKRFNPIKMSHKTLNKFSLTAPFINMTTPEEILLVFYRLNIIKVIDWFVDDKSLIFFMFFHTKHIHFQTWIVNRLNSASNSRELKIEPDVMKIENDTEELQAILTDKAQSQTNGQVCLLVDSPYRILRVSLFPSGEDYWSNIIFEYQIECVGGRFHS